MLSRRRARGRQRPVRGPHRAQRPGQVDPLDGHGHEAPGVEVVRDGQGAEHRGPLTAAGGRQDRRGGPQLQPVAQPAEPGQGVFEHLPRARARLADDKLGGRQVGASQRGLQACPRVRRIHHHDEVIGPHRHGLHLLSPGVVALHEPRVGVVLGHPGKNLRRVGHLHGQDHLGRLAVQRRAAQAGTRSSASLRRARRPAHSEEMIPMTGSNVAVIVIPIVVMLSLAAWIAMVFHAASHPFWGEPHRARQAIGAAAVPDPAGHARPVHDRFRGGRRGALPVLGRRGAVHQPRRAPAERRDAPTLARLT